MKRGLMFPEHQEISIGVPKKNLKVLGMSDADFIAAIQKKGK